jgi:hypothetical protein
VKALDETKKALIVVRTYPTPAENGVEVSCTAAISDKDEWLRLHPIRYRYLHPEQRFQKYQWIELKVTKTRDGRPESYTPKNETIKIISEPLGTANGWQARKEFLFPRRTHCLCCLKKLRDKDGYPTLGLFRPKLIEALLIKPSSPNWTDRQLAILRQEDPHQLMCKPLFAACVNAFSTARLATIAFSCATFAACAAASAASAATFISWIRPRISRSTSISRSVIALAPSLKFRQYVFASVNFTAGNGLMARCKFQTRFRGPEMRQRFPNAGSVIDLLSDLFFER